jgi:hypothetical protein
VPWDRAVTQAGDNTNKADRPVLSPLLTHRVNSGEPSLGVTILSLTDKRKRRYRPGPPSPRKSEEEATAFHVL